MIKIMTKGKMVMSSLTFKKIGKKILFFLDDIVTYFWINTTAIVAIVFFRLLNRTEVIGRQNVPLDKDVLLCSNHQTMIDSFLIGAIAYFPIVMYHPNLLPYHPAALENFFKGKIIKWMSRKWKCIPVRRGERDMLALSNMIKALKKGTMILFPEGTRSRTGNVGAGRVGVGKLIYDTQATVIPVAIYGMDKVLPIGSFIPRFFQKLKIVYGKPMELEEYLQMPHGKTTSRLIVDKVISEITDLHNHLKTRDYLEKARKISVPQLRQKEISEMSSFADSMRSARAATIPIHEQHFSEQHTLSDEQIH